MRDPETTRFVSCMLRSRADLGIHGWVAKPWAGGPDDPLPNPPNSDRSNQEAFGQQGTPQESILTILKKRV